MLRGTPGFLFQRKGKPGKKVLCSTPTKTKEAIEQVTALGGNDKRKNYAVDSGRGVPLRK